MFDPRDAVTSPQEALTEDSDDALADLEKEFAARRQKLLEEKERKRAQKAHNVQVERSPSPPRKRGRVCENPGLLASEGVENSNSCSKVLENATQHKLYVTTPYFERAKESALKNQSEQGKTASSTTKAGTTNTANLLRNTMRRVKESGFASRLYESKTVVQTEINYNDRIFEFENVPTAKLVATTESNAKDPVSGETLSRRYLPAETVDKLLTNIKVLRVGKLLAKVVAPKYEEPTYVNWCFCGVVMHKSEPKTAVNNKKYMLLRVGGFLHTVDVMLFGDAFQRFWKVRTGDVIIVLNPTVKKIGNSFNLSLLDDLNCVLEVGTLKHYAHCSATTKEGKKCKNIVDSLQNVLCLFHEEQKYKQGSRMELQGVKPRAPHTKYGGVGEMHVNRTTNQPFVHYVNNGFQEKDEIFSGGHQFDESKYDRPIETKASKLRKARANAKLENQLLQTVAPRHLDDLALLGIVNKDKVDQKLQSARNIRKHAFNSSFITGMGFDPTLASSRDAGRSLEQLQELRQLSQTKKISLGMSREDAFKKKDKWKAAMKLTNKPKKDPVSPIRSSRATVILDLDSESDIEITFTRDLQLLQERNAPTGD